MALYGTVVTNRGRNLIAKLMRGDTFAISRVAVGSGKVDEEMTAMEMAGMTDLIFPRAIATSTVPVVKNGTASFTIEYGSHMNGGLDTELWIREFGVYAYDPDEGEILFLYGTLGNYPIYISPYSATTINSTVIPDNVVRFPINIAIGEGVDVTVDYVCNAWMTAEEVREYCITVLLPELLANAEKLIAEHNISEYAHPDIRKLIADLQARVRVLELGTGSGNKFLVTFETLTDLTVTGVWNEPAARIEF